MTEKISKAELKVELLKRGVRIDIGGCGCCGSPWVKIELDNRLVIDEDQFHIEMIGGE